MLHLTTQNFEICRMNHWQQIVKTLWVSKILHAEIAAELTG